MKKLTAFIMAAALSFASFGISADNGIFNNTECTTVYASDDISEYADKVVVLVNKERAKKSLPPLKTAPVLNKMAEVRSNELVKNFSHTRPDGTKGLQILDSYGLNYWYAGENIAAGYPTPEKVVAGWMNSPGHRANILDSDFEYIGVGAVYDSSSEYGTYWTQLFYKLQDPLDDAYIPVETGEIKGDIDGSGNVDSYDALLVLQAVVHETEVDLKKFDIDGDGNVTASDAFVILQYIAGIVNEI